jgi:50S ribosomal protein uL3
MSALNRRQFVAASAIGAAGFFTGCACVPGRRASPNSKVAHACIGVGGMGYNDLTNYKSHARTEIVAICDVDKNHLDKAAALVPDARRYTDWREMLAKEGDKIDVSIFEIGEKVKVSGITKAKGFQGVVKRHGFKGAPKTHGHKHDLRAPGSIGSGFPEHVTKGKRMAGRMGGERATSLNVKVAYVDKDKNIIGLKGAVPGIPGNVIEIRSAA